MQAKDVAQLPTFQRIAKTVYEMKWEMLNANSLLHQAEDLAYEMIMIASEKGKYLEAETAMLLAVAAVKTLTECAKEERPQLYLH